MNTTKISTIGLSKQSYEALFSLFSNSEDQVALLTPWDPYVYQWTVEDMAIAYLKLLFIGETIADFCQTIDIFEEEQGIYFLFRANKPEELAHALCEITPGIDPDWDSEDGDMYDSQNDGIDVDMLEIQNIMTDFADSLENRMLHFPTLADDYMAYRLAMGNDTDAGYESSNVEHERQNEPVRDFGFFRSFFASTAGYTFYVSLGIWIVPPDQSVPDLLCTYFKNDTYARDLEPASYKLGTDGEYIVSGQYTAVRLINNILATAQECATAVWTAEAKDDIEVAENTMSFELSRDYDLVVVSDRRAQYVLFEWNIQHIAA